MNKSFAENMNSAISEDPTSGINYDELMNFLDRKKKN